ncbi:MAG: hypothetical protein ACRC14_03870, partial [Paracoccaceae bacterium]
NTVHALGELIAAAGLTRASEISPHHFLRRAGAEKVVSYAESYERLKPGQLLSDGPLPVHYYDAWRLSQAASFDKVA